MQYRLISLDLDGTLLNGDCQISSRNAQALDWAASKGARIVITTGRILMEAHRLTEGLRSVSAIASSNGAYIVGVEQHEILFERPIEQGPFEEITTTLDDSSVFYCVYGIDTIYVPKNVLQRLPDSISSKEGKLCKIALVDDIRIKAIRDGGPVYKINVFDRDIKALSSLRKGFEVRNDVEIASSSPCNIEVTAKGVHKGNALQVFSELWGINSREMAAFGDGENDIPMFKRAGLSIAMGNAPMLVKDAASRVTRTNHEDGVASVVEELFVE